MKRKCDCPIEYRWYYKGGSKCLKCGKDMDGEDAQFLITIERKAIPRTNMEETKITIEAGYIPNDVLADVAEAIKKYC